MDSKPTNIQTKSPAPAPGGTTPSSIQRQYPQPFYILRKVDKISPKQDLLYKVNKLDKQMRHLGVAKKVKKSFQKFIRGGGKDKSKHKMSEIFKDVQRGSSAEEIEARCTLKAVNGRFRFIGGQPIVPFNPGQMSGFRLHYTKMELFAAPASGTSDSEESVFKVPPVPKLIIRKGKRSS